MLIIFFNGPVLLYLYIILYTYFYIIFNIFISVLVMFTLQLIIFQLVTKATFLIFKFEITSNISNFILCQLDFNY